MNFTKVSRTGGNQYGKYNVVDYKAVPKFEEEGGVYLTDVYRVILLILIVGIAFIIGNLIGAFLNY